ncbi:F-box domain protein [Nile crocodilepox virus]|uniref:F-box domain protein n=1 Tax=Nile crocodilepox virus (isolate Crocodylus niloticus/Zimbabwe/Ume/2001) TaxID=1289473 RepID=Q070P0_CPRVZ|nr:F-box domain protein [Nile crocodilepox virus]ABJ08902.1 F-box domain protein [Nile crocodilepox virus]
MSDLTSPLPPADEITMDALPPEVVCHVFVFLDDRDLAACRATCRAWRDAADADYLWTARFRQRFGFLPPPGVDRRAAYCRFPHGRNALPLELRSARAVDAVLDLRALGCHPAVLERCPDIAVSSYYANPRRMVQYDMRVILLSRGMTRVTRSRRVSFAPETGEFRHEFSGYSEPVYFVELSRYSDANDTLDLRIAPRASGAAPARSAAATAALAAAPNVEIKTIGYSLHTRTLDPGEIDNAARRRDYRRGLAPRLPARRDDAAGR